jgi:hypothetical protein
MCTKQLGCLRRTWAHEIPFFARNPELGLSSSDPGRDGSVSDTRAGILERAVLYDVTCVDQPDKVGDVAPRPESPDEESVFQLG